MTSSHNLHPVTLVRTLDALRDGRRRAYQKKKSKQQHLDDPLRHLRRVQEDDGKTSTCEAALAEAEENLATCEEKEEEPSYLFVQMADQCIFQTTDGGNTVLKSRHFHDVTVVFSDRPFEYEEEIATESFFDDFDATFNAGNGGKPNAAITLVQNDESKDVVVSVFVKAVVKHRDDPDGPTYVYKLEQSDEQASVASLSDVMGGKDKMTYDHCSIFIDAVRLCTYMYFLWLMTGCWRCPLIIDVLQNTHPHSFRMFVFVFLNRLFVCIIDGSVLWSAVRECLLRPSLVDVSSSSGS